MKYTGKEFMQFKKSIYRTSKIRKTSPDPSIPNILTPLQSKTYSMIKQNMRKKNLYNSTNPNTKLPK